MTESLNGNVAIVGGSLAGLAAGIGLARRGTSVNVLEQNSGEERGGTGLGVDRALLSETTGVDARVDGFTHALPVVDEGYRETSTWLAIYRWLRAVADVTDALHVHESARVDVISSDDHAAYLSGPSVNTSADVLIGADGYRSMVRRAVSPTQPFARYGGFLLWRALVEESWLPKQLLARTSLGGGRSQNPEVARLVVYRVPGPNGETSRGKRSITLAWYDASRTQWLRERGFLVGDEVMGSILPAAVDDELRAELRAVAAKRWRGAAREVVISAIEHKVIFGTPLAEYLPERLVAGRLGMVGDAAHVASPMVGAGFSSSRGLRRRVRSWSTQRGAGTRDARDACSSCISASDVQRRAARAVVRTSITRPQFTSIDRGSQYAESTRCSEGRLMLSI
jgi:2-polyprenyl-6-methoxyphenol hydroxylase-like FAD-dependent oxidoreductase